MKKEDNTEVKAIHHDKNYKQKLCVKLVKKQEKNGILPWKNMEKMKKMLQTNESGQPNFEERNGRVEPFSHQDTSQPLPLSTEQISEDFSTELPVSPFSDQRITSDFKPPDGYVPYYRTYGNLVETPLCMNVDLIQANTEKGIQSHGCVFNPQYEDETVDDMGIFATGYFPYYRTCEEYLCCLDSPCEVHSAAESEEAELNNGEEIESEIGNDNEDVCEDTVS